MSIFFVIVLYRTLEKLYRNLMRTEALVNQLRSMMEVSPNGILLVNRQGHIQQANAMITELFGYSEEELRQRNVDELLPQQYQRQHGELRLGFFADPLKRAMGIGKTLQACRKDGSLFYVEIGLAPLTFEREEFVMAVVTDVTSQKELEWEQGELNKRILESNEQLKRFAYAASHDLQAPLRRVAGFIQLLQSNYQGRLDTEADAWIDRAVSNLERMQDMIRGLLRMSIIQAEQEEHHFVSLQEVLDQVLELQAINLASVDVQLGQNFPAVTGDQTQLLMLFENLVGNAAKYVSEQPEINIFLFEENDESCVVAIKDNGIGIDPKNHQEIFAMFKRLHSYREYEGHGLGLALCKTIVDKHHGEIWCESALGQGSTFYVRLPK